MDVMRENDLSFCDKTNTERLISNMDSIVNILKTIGVIKASKDKVNDLGDTFLLNLRAFYDSMNEYITEEYNIWEDENYKQE